MPRIQLTHLAAAQRRVQALSGESAQALADRIYAKQPNLLASVLVLTRYGVTYDVLDLVLRVLFICYEAVSEGGYEIRTVSEADQERCLGRVVGKAKFLDGLDEQSSARAVADQIQGHLEPHLLAAAFAVLNNHGLTSVRTEAEKYAVLAVMNLVEVTADALNEA